MANDTILGKMSLRARMTYFAHLYKAVAKQHHLNLLPGFSLFLKLDAIIFDIGAHSGQFTKLYAKIAPKGHIYAIEPGSYAYSILKQAVAINRLKNVTIARYGVSDQEGELELSMPVKKSGSYGFGLSHFGKTADTREHISEKVKVVTIDQLAEEYGIKQMDLIKADIEGWELHLLRGAIKSIQKFHPVIYLELVDEFLQGAGGSLAEAWTLLLENGYQGYYFTEGGKSLVQCEEGSDGDIIFMHSNSAPSA